MSFIELREPNTDVIVKYVDGPCGTGKTYKVGEHIAGDLGLIEGTKPSRKFSYCDAPRHLIVSPSIKLINEQKEMLKSFGVVAQPITSETDPGKVHSRIMEEMKAPRLGVPKVLLITHQSYFSLPYLHRPQDWDIWIDEVPQADQFFNPSLPRHLKLLTRHLKIVRMIGDKLALVAPQKTSTLKRLLEGPKDDIEAPIRDILAAALSPCHFLFVDYADWKRMEEDKVVSNTADGNRLHFLSMLNHTRFSGVTLLGANIKNSLIYHWLSSLGCDFREHIISQGLRYRKYPEAVGKRVRIHYAMDRGHFSKTFRDKVLEDGSRNLEKLECPIIDFVGESDFLFVSNNDYDGKILKCPGCQRIPVVAHGLNEFQDYNMIVSFAALNRSPKHYKLLKALGLHASVAKTATQYEALHQAVMRTSLRNPAATDPVDIVVPDQGSADFLVEVLGAGEVTKIGSGTFQKKFPYTKKQIKKRHRFKKNKSRIFQNQNKEQVILDIKNKSSISRRSAASAAARSSIIWVTFTETPFGKFMDDFQKLPFEPLKLRSFLVNCSGTVMSSKDEGFLFTLSEFGDTGPDESYRNKKNFLKAHGIVLDFDDGDMSPEEFQRIFWADAGEHGKRSFIITNSYSRSKEQPNRYRVIMPFVRPAQTLEEIYAVYEAVVERLKDNGFPPDKSGLDRNSRTGVQLFWLPCTNRAHPEFAFFRHYGLTRNRDFEQYAIDPRTYLLTTEGDPKHFITGTEKRKRYTVRTGDRDIVLSQLRKQYKGMSEGRRPYYLSVANRLVDRGFPPEEVETHLYEIFGRDENATREINIVIEKLKSEGRLW